MGLLALLALFVFGVLIMNNEPTGYTGKRKLCPPHKWEYKKEQDGVERLNCIQCGGKPLYESR